MKRSSPDVLATSVQRPDSLARSPTMASQSTPSLVDDPKRAVQVALVAVLLGALTVVGGWWLLREPAATERRTTPTTHTPAVATAIPTATPTPVATPTHPSAVEAVRLVVTPAGARVRRGDVELGDAPLNLPVPSGESWTLRVASDGYEARDVTVLAGQGEVRILLERERGRRPRRVAEPEPTPIQPTPLVDPAPTPMRDPTREPSVRTDNRDPWAR